MLRSRLFWKLFLAFSVVNLLAAYLLLRGMLSWSEDRVYDQAERQLRAIAALMHRAYGDALREEPSPELQQELMRLGEESGYRLTLIDPDGRVLADSSQADLDAVLAMENHAERAEVQKARIAGSGVVRRTSTTVGEPFVYVAVRHELPEGRPATVRAATAVQVLEQQVDFLQQRLTRAALLIAATLLGVTYLVVRSIVLPVLELNAAADAVGRGDYDQRAFVPNRDELGALGASFNRMCGELAEQIDKLQRSGQQQATVLGGMVEGVIAIDAQQRVVLANRAAGSLLGFRPESVEGRPLVEVIRNHTLHDALSEAQSSGRPHRLDIEQQGAESLLLSVQITPLAGDESGAAVIVLHNITELRRLESIRQEFIANVSHELKTPLASIKAYTETLIGGALHDEQHAMQFLQRIEEQADRLNALIQDMLSLARIESAEQSFELASIVVGEAVAACLSDYSPQAESREIILIADSLEPNAEVLADPEGLRVILGNLVDNAIKYTPKGGTVTVAWQSTDDDQVRLAVSDSGIGIPKDELPRVFERFHRVDKARSRELGGTGLGLSIVKHLTQSFGGAVAVESQVDVGTTFTVTLPRP